MKEGRKNLIKLFICFILLLMVIPCLCASDVSQQSNDDISADGEAIAVTDDYSSNILNVASQNQEPSIDEGIQNEGVSEGILSEGASGDVLSEDSQSVIYVNATGGSDENEGLGWDNAVQSVDKALSIASADDSICFADGIYHINNSASKVISKNLVFIGQSQNGTIIEGSNNFGFTINRGISLNASCMTFRNFNNSDANGYGGVFEVIGTLNLANVSFYNNSALKNGGAIDLADKGTGNLHMIDSYFENNHAYEGGCISSYGYQNVEVINSTFAGSYATRNGGAIAIKSEGFYTYVFNITGCRFINNYCTNMGDSYGGAVYIRDSLASITDSSFINNSAQWGGAIGSSNNKNLNIQSSLFLNNTNASRGGAIYLHRFTNPKINYNVFINNMASYDLNSNGDDSVICFGEDKNVSLEYNWFGHTIDNSSFDTSIISYLSAPKEYLVLNYSRDLNILDLGDLAVIRYDLTKTQLGNVIDAGRLPDFKIAIEAVNGSIDVDELSFENGVAKATFNAQNVGNAAVIADLYDKNIITHFYINEPSNFTFSIADMSYGNANKLAVSVSANATGNIIVTINDANYTAPIENGKAIINIPELAAGKYSILFSYEGNEEYPPCIKHANFTVNDVYSLSVGNLNAYYGYGTALLATLYKNGKPLSGASVAYSFGSSKYAYNTNSLGQAKFVVTNLKPGSYNIKVSYGSLSKTVKVTVKKVAVKYTKITKKVKKGKYFSFKVLTKNNKIIKKQKVSIKIGKRTYNVKTNSKGIAKVKVKLSPKKYKTVIKMVSNAYYTTSKKTVKIRVKK